jgi:protein phosphatase methylesterase 1
MGAAPVLSASPVLQSKGYQVPGVVVLDVVEGEQSTPHDQSLILGTAVEALPIMKSILAKRPSSFQSVVDAVHWQWAIASSPEGLS